MPCQMPDFWHFLTCGTCTYLVQLVTLHDLVRIGISYIFWTWRTLWSTNILALENERDSILKGKKGKKKRKNKRGGVYLLEKLHSDNFLNCQNKSILGASKYLRHLQWAIGSGRLLFFYSNHYWPGRTPKDPYAHLQSTELFPHCLF